MFDKIRSIGIDQRHEICVGEKSLLNEITGCLKGAVNSAHHQCIDTLANDFTVAARAEESIIEAIQWKDVKEHPFYLGVQVRFILEFCEEKKTFVFSGTQNE